MSKKLRLVDRLAKWFKPISSALRHPPGCLLHSLGQTWPHSSPEGAVIDQNGSG